MPKLGERTNLKVFRIQQKMTQAEFAEKIGCNRGTYAAIEKGTRNGQHKFWLNLQHTFNISDADMWALKKRDGE